MWIGVLICLIINEHEQKYIYISSDLNRLKHTKTSHAYCGSSYGAFTKIKINYKHLYPLKDVWSEQVVVDAERE